MPFKDLWGVGTRIVATNRPAEEIVTYLGRRVCAITPPDESEPYLIVLDDLVQPRLYTRDDHGGSPPPKV